MPRLSNAHWNLWVFVFLVVFSVVYSFRQNISQMFGQPQIFSASLTMNSNKPMDGFTSDDSLNITPDQGLQINQLPEKDSNIISDIAGSNVVMIQPLDDKQDKIDNLLEKIDMLKKQLADALEAQHENQNQDEDQDQDEIKIIVKEEEKIEKIHEEPPQQNSIQLTTYSNSNGGGSPFYPNILISELQISGTGDTKQEFVELYNPHAIDIDLAGWYLQRKTPSGSSYSTFAPNTLFTGKKITAKSYFLIARQGYFINIADVSVDNPLTDDNSLVLKNPNGEISDKVGFGNSQDYELLATQNPPADQSIGRKLVLGEEQDTDNNLADFEIDAPTPKANNMAYVAPPAPIPKDDVAPHAVFNIHATQNNLSFTVSFDITDTAVGVAPSGVAGYTLKWKEETSDWQEDAYKNVDGSPAAFSGTKDVTGTDEKNYYFQIKIKDVSGNESDWQPEIPVTTKISIPKKILISEIQAAGKTVKDEFIELYNPNDVHVDLLGFALKKKTFTGTESNLVSASAFSGTIKAFGFFLIVPQKNNDESENYKGLVAPDLRYSGATFSLSSDTTVLLYDNNKALLDKVGFGNAIDFETAAAQNPPADKSLARKELGRDTDDNALDFDIQDPSPKESVDDSLPIVSDTISPIRSHGQPHESIASGITQIDLILQTDEPAICKYAISVGKEYDEMLDIFLTTGEILHTTMVTGLADGNRYTYDVKCKDIMGNKNTDDFIIAFDVALPELPPPKTVVVINEIAWMGSINSTDEEWIELFNPTDQAVDLAGWTLVSTDGTPEIQLSKSIDARGFYLLERTNDDSVPGVVADHIYTGALENGGEYLYLYDASSNLKDEINCATDWFMGSNITKQTMQRKDPFSFSNSQDNWQTSQDAGGTPRF